MIDLVTINTYTFCFKVFKHFLFKIKNPTGKLKGRLFKTIFDQFHNNVELNF